MNNQIGAIRDDIRKFFSEDNRIENTDMAFLHPDGCYYLTVSAYRQTDPLRNWVVSKLEIFRASHNEKIASYFTSGELSMVVWIKKNETDYLLSPEDIMGQSILNLHTGVLESVSYTEEQFMWQNAMLSPDAKYLAVTGCYWACPEELVVFNVEDIEQLPYPVVRRWNLYPHVKLDQWLDGQTIQLRGQESHVEICKL